MNRKIVGYQILKSRWLGELTTAVEGCLKDGYEPSGSLQIEEVKNTDRDAILLPTFSQYLQPMVKYAEPDPDRERYIRVQHNSALIMAQMYAVNPSFIKNPDSIAAEAICAAAALDQIFEDTMKTIRQNRIINNL